VSVQAIQLIDHQKVEWPAPTRLRYPRTAVGVEGNPKHRSAQRGLDGAQSDNGDDAVLSPHQPLRWTRIV